MQLFEAKQILKENGYILESIRWGGHTFSRPSLNRVYVKVLLSLYEGDKSKKEIQEELGLSMRPGSSSSMWTALSDEGLISFDKSRNLWSLTVKGINYLEDNDLIRNFNEDPYTENDELPGEGLRFTKEI